MTIRQLIEDLTEAQGYLGEHAPVTVDCGGSIWSIDHGITIMGMVMLATSAPVNASGNPES